MATLLPYVGTGPQWYAIEMESHNCEVHWWHNILYINNLISYGDAEAGEVRFYEKYSANFVGIEMQIIKFCLISVIQSRGTWQMTCNTSSWHPLSFTHCGVGNTSDTLS